MAANLFKKLTRSLREIAFGFEALFINVFRRMSGRRRRPSAGAYVEDAVGRVATSWAARAGNGGQFKNRLESFVEGAVGLIRRWRLNYFFGALILIAVLYQIYLISTAESAAVRGGLVTSLRFTIYFAILFFSLALFLRSPVRPGQAIVRGWWPILRHIWRLPGAFLTCFTVFFAARAVSYLPSALYLGREPLFVLGNFLLGLLFFVTLAFVTLRLYRGVIAEKLTQEREVSPLRIMLVCAALWIASAVVTSLLMPLTSLAPPRFTAIVFQLSWLMQMVWNALIVFVVPSVLAGLAAPIATGLRASLLVLWTMIVTLILVNLPADIFQVITGLTAARLPATFPVRVALDAVGALVNSLVFFASQVAILHLFVSVVRHYDLRARRVTEAVA